MTRPTLPPDGGLLIGVVVLVGALALARLAPSATRWMRGERHAPTQASRRTWSPTCVGASGWTSIAPTSATLRDGSSRADVLRGLDHPLGRRVAIKACEQAQLTDAETIELCDQIVQAQREEIAQMRKILDRLDG